MQTQGKKEIQEAVLTAALCAVATGIVGFAFEVFARRWFKEEEKKPAAK